MHIIKEINPNAILQVQKQYMPKELFAIGNLDLLNKPAVAIVGARRASQYSKMQTYTLAKAVSEAGGVVVSGGAMGIDAVAHEGAYPNTIAVLANGADVNYPQINKELLNKIRQNGLILSEHKEKTKPTKYGFVARNRIVVALSKAVIISEAEVDSGSMRSYEWAQKFNISVFVLPQRLNESSGTNKLLKEGLVTPIYDFNDFLKSIGLQKLNNMQEDEVLKFCAKNPTYEEAYLKFKDKILEYELEGKIKIETGIVTLC